MIETIELIFYPTKKQNPAGIPPAKPTLLLALWETLLKNHPDHLDVIQHVFCGVMTLDRVSHLLGSFGDQNKRRLHQLLASYRADLVILGWAHEKHRKRTLTPEDTLYILEGFYNLCFATRNLKDSLITDNMKLVLDVLSKHTLTSFRDSSPLLMCLEKTLDPNQPDNPKFAALIFKLVIEKLKYSSLHTDTPAPLQFKYYSKTLDLLDKPQTREKILGHIDKHDLSKALRSFSINCLINQPILASRLVRELPALCYLQTFYTGHNDNDVICGRASKELKELAAWAQFGAVRTNLPESDMSSDNALEYKAIKTNTGTLYIIPSLARVPQHFLDGRNTFLEHGHFWEEYNVYTSGKLGANLYEPEHVLLTVIDSLFIAADKFSDPASPLEYLLTLWEALFDNADESACLLSAFENRMTDAYVEHLHQSFNERNQKRLISLIQAHGCDELQQLSIIKQAVEDAEAQTRNAAPVPPSAAARPTTPRASSNAAEGESPFQAGQVALPTTTAPTMTVTDGQESAPTVNDTPSKTHQTTSLFASPKSCGIFIGAGITSSAAIGIGTAAILAALAGAITLATAGIGLGIFALGVAITLLVVGIAACCAREPNQAASAASQ